MRWRSSFPLALALATLAAASAPAAPLGFTGTLTLQLNGLGPVVIGGSGVASVNGVGVAGLPITQLSIPGGAFAVSTTLPPQTPLAPIVDFQVVASNLPLLLSASAATCRIGLPPVTCAGGGLHGRAGLAGILAVGLSGSFGAPLFTIPVPLGVVGGAGLATGLNATTGGTVQLFGAGWTTRTVTAFGTAGGLPVGTVMGVGGQGTTPGGLLTLQAVTPIAIRTNLLPGVTLGGIGTLHLVFVPEPATGLLLGLGVLGLAVMGRRHRNG